jgi:hypothetical protein
VQVVRENYVATNPNAEIILSSFAEFHESFVNTIIRKMRPTPIGAASYEIKWITWENDVESPRGSGEFRHDLLLRSRIESCNTADAVAADLWAARRVRADAISAALRRAKRLQFSNRLADIRERDLARKIGNSNARCYNETDFSAFEFLIELQRVENFLAWKIFGQTRRQLESL